MRAERKHNRSLREQIETLKAGRDHALPLLVEADAKIVDLLQDNAELLAMLTKSNVAPIAGRKPSLHGPSAAQNLAPDSEFEDIK